MVANLDITRPSCVLDRRKNSCLYVPGFRRQVFNLLKVLVMSKENERTNDFEQIIKYTVWPCNGTLKDQQVSTYHHVDGCTYFYLEICTLCSQPASCNSKLA